MRASAAAESSVESRWAAGVITLFYGAASALVAGLALAAATGWPTLAVVSSAVAFGVLVGVQSRLIARGPIQGWKAVTGRAAIAVVVGVVVGELTVLALFAGAVDRSLDDAAARSADAVPAVVQASADLNQSRAARTELDVAVEQSRDRLDHALVVARCEYNPSPACPQTLITGMPGRGPETRTANELLADARQDLDASLGLRERRAPELDTAIVADERALGNARATAVAASDRGLGARWVAMHEYTLAGAGTMLLRLATVAFSVLLNLFPLILKLSRGQTTNERLAAAQAERERAELEADTAIAVKRSEVRRTAEVLWAEQQLASARLAIEAQHEIDRSLHQRRVAQALEGHIHAEPQQEEQEELAADMFEPKQLDSAAAAPARINDHLPAPVESHVAERDQRQVLPGIPDLTRSAVRWIRPLVPPIVAKAIDSTAHPVRTARQVFEEVEEINFSLRRTHTVTVHSTDNPPSEKEHEPARDDDEGARRRVESSVVRGDLGADNAEFPSGALSGRSPNVTLGVGGSRPRGLSKPDGARQLPSGG